MKKNDKVSRRTTLKTLGILGTSAIIGSAGGCSEQKRTNSGSYKHNSGEIFEQINKKVEETPFIDTHEHLIEEHRRFNKSEPRGDDWTYVLSHYFDSDLLVAGMKQSDFDKFYSLKTDPIEKWQILKPFWPYVKNTGYGQAVKIAIEKLYGVADINDNTIAKVQSGYDSMRKPGFYRHILRDVANIESCQVNCLDGPFAESSQPTLLMQDLSFVGMHAGPFIEAYQPKTGIAVNNLSDWHKVIDWWFNKYGKYAVAVKSQDAYGRDINYEQVAAEQVEEIFKKRLRKEKLEPAEKKALEDHLFWYAVSKADELNLPVKLHTGYYVGQNNMPLERISHNAGSACDLCRRSPQTRFVFFHICYPYYEEMIALAKHYTNGYVDMCWSWIINPVAAKDFLKKLLVTAPANKVFTFGGDYGPVEPVVGHAAIARRGITLALTELVEEGWMNLDDALGIIRPIMHGNAYNFYNLAEKERILSNVKWG
jgi:predicted TIM-barrel fold metal-dependent hydrolase